MYMQGPFLLKLLLAIEPIVVLNGALCEHHLRHCPSSEQLLSECRKVRPCMRTPGQAKLTAKFGAGTQRTTSHGIHVTGGPQVADLEHELDDIYDDLEPVLRNLECKDANVRTGSCHQNLALICWTHCHCHTANLAGLHRMRVKHSYWLDTCRGSARGGQRAATA